ncbi:proteasome subunit alpha type-3 [Trichonephila clavipes]|uniref:Proteasome subunit alpha type n=1 Tax=Trichonephila clavipes TaxID=2585209 RepID=A0A8X6RH23_TRICX|nr:proteasome subunit alpha type-3 [Trichonephila clavipes]
MSSIATGYDLLASQFSPDGRIFQIEYAQKALLKSGTAIGLRGTDCVVLAAEKLSPSKLYESDAYKRIFTVAPHIGIVITGFTPDGRHLVETAKTEAVNYKNSYNHDIPLQHLKNRVAMYMHAYTCFGALRPFGVSLMLAAYNSDGPELAGIDLSGASFNYFGYAVGKNHAAAKTEIEKLDLKNMENWELVKEATKILYMIHDDRDKNFELELSWVGKNTRGKHVNVPNQVFREAQNYAIAAVEERDSDEEL